MKIKTKAFGKDGKPIEAELKKEKNCPHCNQKIPLEDLWCLFCDTDLKKRR